MALALLQAAQRLWSPEAVHDTIRAVLRDPAFRRSLQRSWLDRLLTWFNDWLHRFDKFLQHLPARRTVGFLVVGLIVLFVVARVLAAAYSSTKEEPTSFDRAKSTRSDDPWLQAEQFAAAGRYEEAAHQLYRGVVLSITREARIRLDPSMTSGDYARALRKRGATSYGPFRAFTRRFDFAVYGHGPCDRVAYDDLRALSVSFEPRARVA